VSRIDLDGLDESLAADLQRRWGGFVVERPATPPDLAVRFGGGGPGTWLERWKPGEVYRIEASGGDEDRVVASYHFALERRVGETFWRAGISADPQEPLPRIAENVVRFLVAHLALDLGGFAMHAAGVLHEGRAVLFAGPSRAGKSTAAKLVRGAQSLGDDYGLVVRTGDGWSSPAVPFDNSERVENRPSSGSHPVAAVWRLHQSDETRVEHPLGLAASAGLISCAAFAWAMPERSGELLDHVRSFAEQGLFHELYFTRDADLGRHLALAEDKG
jgi:hypothetical protein